MESNLGLGFGGREGRRFHRLVNNSVALFFAINAGSEVLDADAIAANVICAGCSNNSSIKLNSDLNNMKFRILRELMKT